MSDEIDDLQQLYELIQDSLSSDDVKAFCVLGSNKNVLKYYEEFEEDCESPFLLIKWMGNLMTLAGAFLYAKFNQWRTETRDHLTEKEYPNALYLKRLLAGVQNTNAYFEQASSGLRILRVLDGLYDNLDMNFLVIKYLITNLQIEAGFNFQGKGGLSQLIGFPNEKSLRVTCSPDVFKTDGQNLSAAFNLVSACRSDDNLVKTHKLYKRDKVSPLFVNVFKTLEFMKRVKLDIDSEGNVNFRETISSGEEKYIPSNGVVRIFETKKGKCTGVYKSDTDKKSDKDFYILEKIEYIQDNTSINAAVKLLYQSFDDSNSVSVYHSENGDLKPKGCSFSISMEKSAADYFKRVSGYLPGMQSSAQVSRGMINPHFRYFDILASSIVDAIDTDHDIDVKKRILKKLEESLFKEALKPTFKTLETTFGEVFKEEWEKKINRLCEFRKGDEYYFHTTVDWDALILRILKYEGQSEILRTVLLCDKRDYEIKDKKILENTCKKIIAGLSMRYNDNIFKASVVANEQKEYHEKIKLKLKKLKDYYPEHYIRKMECKALAQSYIDTIISKLARIDDDKNNKMEAEDKFAENSIQDTLEILEEYYEEKEYSKAYKVFLETIKAFLSFYAGIREICSSRVSYEFEKSTSILKPEEIEAKQLEIENTFLENVGKKNSELFNLFNNKPDEADAVKCALTELWKFANIPSEEAKYYKAVLGRAPIDSEKLAKVFNVNEEKIKFISNEKKYSFDNVKDSKKIIECLADVIKFLAGFEMDNNDEGNSKDYKEHVKMVIYPQIVTFAKHHEDSDSNKCLIMNHSGAFADWHKGGVQILTEFKYEINHSYYALPNINSIDTAWWVEPILVSCDKFDEVIRKTSADKENMQ